MSSKYCVCSLLVAFLIVGCGRKANEISGNGACNDYTESHLSQLRAKGDLQSARDLRDLILDCDLTKERFEEALMWAKIAAEKGNALDKKNYQALIDRAEPR